MKWNSSQESKRVSICFLMPMFQQNGRGERLIGQVPVAKESTDHARFAENVLAPGSFELIYRDARMRVASR